ncbi:hypothetical protein Tsubulata_036602 [Turnera subulata]|uniref:Peptidase M20 dimerisation domain-containing protein n=1 Tax=Turnera subulata TaxID=218843 RepID=A0A9Q0FLU4_9ROSI|nr:hypothetical protein Tsubulata_036602 [Turnera subulata]
MMSNIATHRPLLSLFHFLLVVVLLVIVLPAAAAAHEEETCEPGDTPVGRFQQYLRFNTAHPNPNYRGPVSFLASIAASLSLQIQTLELAPGKPTLLLSWQGSDPSLPSLLFNSHLDSVPVEPSKWSHPPFSATRSPDGRIFARGAQDDKCIGIQYLEAIRNLKENHPHFSPLRSLHLSFVPDEEVGGFDGMAKFVESPEFKALNVGFLLDEGQASVGEEFRVFYADRAPWELVIKAAGDPGHASRMYDNSAMENLMKSVEVISRFRESQFDVVKAGKASNSEVISVNPVYVKAGIPSPPNGFVMNMQPSEAEAGFDLRMPPTTDPELMMQKIAQEWAPAARNMTFKVIQKMLFHYSCITMISFLCSHYYWLEMPMFIHCSLCVIIKKGPLRDFMGRPLITATNDSNPWWSIFKQAIEAAGGKLSKPEMLASTSDARFLRRLGIPALGFSPMTNTPILLHEHDECLKDTVFLRGIEVYEHIIRALTSFEEVESV